MDIVDIQIQVGTTGTSTVEMSAHLLDAHLVASLQVPAHFAETVRPAIANIGVARVHTTVV